ncbi:MAG TPA: lysylphosphatidylglycerol synthase transmembrane domain-containing protein [Acidimicrobiales bacterium]|nr:lysylphosphatidylglycerol synthase transmembrane domain-containing protein [Acidimicrobiales bacterium]
MRRRVMAAARVVASVVILAILVPRVHLSSLLPPGHPHTFLWVAAALGVTFVGIVLSALRWQRVLAALDLDARLPTLVKHYLASLFVGNVLISTVGGDVLRVSRLSSTNHDVPGTFASVVVERLTGWLVLPAITLGALAINPGLRHLHRATGLAVTVALTTLVLLAAVLAAASSKRIGGRFASTEGWRRFTGAIHLGLTRFRDRPTLALEVLTAGFAYQLAVMVTAYFASEALGLHVGWTAILAFFPAVAILQVLPISIGGFGVREGALVIFLHPLGVSATHAVTLGLLFYAINLVVSLLGAPAFAVGGRRARTRVLA